MTVVRSLLRNRIRPSNPVALSKQHWRAGPMSCSRVCIQSHCGLTSVLLFGRGAECERDSELAVSSLKTKVHKIIPVLTPFLQTAIVPAPLSLWECHACPEGDILPPTTCPCISLCITNKIAHSYFPLLFFFPLTWKQ